jgi:hypothetical protein
MMCANTQDSSFDRCAYSDQDMASATGTASFMGAREEGRLPASMMGSKGLISCPHPSVRH